MVSIPGRWGAPSGLLENFVSTLTDLPQKEISTGFRSLHPSVCHLGLLLPGLVFLFSCPPQACHGPFFHSGIWRTSLWRPCQVLCYLVSFEAKEALAGGQRAATGEGWRISLQIPPHLSVPLAAVASLSQATNPARAVALGLWLSLAQKCCFSQSMQAHGC